MRTTPRYSEPPARSDESDRIWRRHRRIVRLGIAILILGALIATTHWLAHVDILGIGQPAGWVDLVAGYPVGLLLVIAGAVIAGHRQPGSGRRA